MLLNYSPKEGHTVICSNVRRAKIPIEIPMEFYLFDETQCGYCGKAAQSHDYLPLMNCPDCQIENYCSDFCMEAHEIVHSIECRLYQSWIISDGIDVVRAELDDEPLRTFFRILGYFGGFDRLYTVGRTLHGKKVYPFPDRCPAPFEESMAKMHSEDRIGLLKGSTEDGMAMCTEGGEESFAKHLVSLLFDHHDLISKVWHQDILIRCISKSMSIYARNFFGMAGARFKGLHKEPSGRWKDGSYICVTARLFKHSSRPTHLPIERLKRFECPQIVLWYVGQHRRLGVGLELTVDYGMDSDDSEDEGLAIREVPPQRVTWFKPYYLSPETLRVYEWKSVELNLPWHYDPFNGPDQSTAQAREDYHRLSTAVKLHRDEELRIEGTEKIRLVHEASAEKLRLQNQNKIREKMTPKSVGLKVTDTHKLFEREVPGFIRPEFEEAERRHRRAQWYLYSHGWSKAPPLGTHAIEVLYVAPEPRRCECLYSVGRRIYSEVYLGVILAVSYVMIGVHFITGYHKPHEDENNVIRLASKGKEEENIYMDDDITIARIR